MHNKKPQITKKNKHKNKQLLKREQLRIIKIMWRSILLVRLQHYRCIHTSTFTYKIQIFLITLWFSLKQTIISCIIQKTDLHLFFKKNVKLNQIKKKRTIKFVFSINLTADEENNINRLHISLTVQYLHSWGRNCCHATTDARQDDPSANQRTDSRLLVSGMNV